MTIGDIIKVEDTTTYTAKIPPDSKKHRIGTFIKIKAHDVTIVGVIKNITHTIREDLIPYIEPQMQPKYAPFNEDFRNSYYLIHGLGKIDKGIVKYDIDSPPDVRDVVEILDHDEIRAFHTLNGKPGMAYLHANAAALPKNVMLAMADQVEADCPECKEMLKPVRKYIQRLK